MQTVDSSSLVQVLDSYSVPIPGTDPQNNTEGFDDEQMEMNEVPDYCFVAIIPSHQQHRLLSLLEQGLSIITPNNPNSASFPHYGNVLCSLRKQRTLPWFPPSETSLPSSQSWKMSYEHESLCKLHTAYNYPGRFGKEGRCFYKLENYIADLCIVKPHYFWTRSRERELWLSAQVARWEAAIKPVNNPLRFYDKNGSGCFVSTNDCSFHGNSTKAINREKQIEQTKTDYEEALQRLLTVKISATNDQYVPIPWHDSITSSAPRTLQADMKNRFDIRSEEKRCRLAIECRGGTACD